MRESLIGLKEGFCYVANDEGTLVFGSHRTPFKGQYNYVCKYNIKTDNLKCTREYISGLSKIAQFTPLQSKEIKEYIRGCNGWKIA